MITPRRTRLVRAPDLHAFRHASCALIAASYRDGHRPLTVVSTTAGASEFRRTLGREERSRDVADHAILLTRDQLYDRLLEHIPARVRRLNAFERDGVLQASGADAAASVPELTFRLRPGLLAEALRFYDQLRRQGQRVDRFESLIEEALGGGATDDRGAERMLHVTHWLAATFREYERRLEAGGRDDGGDEAGDEGGERGVDEHTLRRRLIAGPITPPVTHVIVTVADWVAEPDGLFVADFDMLARLPGLEFLDIVTTEALLGSGFHERLHQWLPGIEEVASSSIGSVTSARPRLVLPAGGGEALWFTHRDREEELVAIARSIKAERRASPADAPSLDRTAVVFKRPLPYLYLAGDTLGAAGIPFTSSSALPLAAEPTAAAVDLLLDAVESNFTRSALVALLRSPHFASAIAGDGIASLDRVLSEAQYLGGLDRLAALVEVSKESSSSIHAAAHPALEAALAWSVELAPLANEAPASVHLARLESILRTRTRPLSPGEPWAAREEDARTVILDLLASLSRAHAGHHDPEWTIADLGPAVRRWIEDQTFARESASATSPTGVRLIDDRAARYGEFDALTIVGLVESDWPEARGMNIFYPRKVLNALGWPSERDWRAAEDARLLDLIASPSRHVTLSSFTLDDERVAMRSIQLDEVHRARLTTVTAPASSPARIFVEEALAVGSPTLDPLDEHTRAWASLRLTRPPSGDDAFHGALGSRPPRRWSVSALETYLTCPFKCFAQYVLRLDEEPDDDEVMDPRRQGLFMHGVFEAFFKAWQAEGHGAITAANLDRARAMFTDIVNREVAHLPPSEAEVERTRLLGSSAAAGLGEAVLRMEAERDVPVVGRLLEHRLDGPFRIQLPAGPRTIDLSGKADRLDLLADGTFRLIDYKLGWPPKGSRALQLGVYALCAEQRLNEDRANAERGRRWTLGEAAYLAFKGPRRVTPLFNSPADRDRVLADVQVRVAETVDAMERGEFPPHPDDVFQCERCSFGSVCRKDYVGDV